ncbi:MAG: A/G-specific adenine glycosylase [Proteobacteria bacterium]|nr:A/G-specific adenine glycosylase [Pseudomonadota bacterium]
MDAQQPPPAALLAWYDRHRRDLPWRVPPGVRSDAYVVWLSEIMLQQTTVAAVAPYFRRILARWPSVAALAAAPLDELLAAWAGLGYYARARNLHRAARQVVARHGGQFPAETEALRALPGVGAYTAAAIAAIAFDRSVVPVDGNVERVVARLFAVAEPLPRARAALRAKAGALAPAVRAGDFAQALMDLGATVCTPRRPRCESCPWADACAGRRLGLAEALPARAPRPERPLRRGVAFWIERADGAVLLRRRPESGLLGGMLEVPSSEWRARRWGLAEAAAAAPLALAWQALPGKVTHTFTHFRLELSVLTGRLDRGGGVVGTWLRPEELAAAALPSLMRKVAAHARAGLAAAGQVLRSRRGRSESSRAAGRWG